MTYIHKVAALTAEDENSAVVKDAHGNLVLDSRDRRVARYRLRWTLIDDDGKKAYKTKRFHRNDREEADEFRVALLHAQRNDDDVGKAGLPGAKTQPAAPTSSQTIEDLLAEYLKAREFASTSNKSGFLTNATFLVDVLRAPVNGALVYDPARRRDSLPLHSVTPDLLREALTIRRHTDLHLRARLMKQIRQHERWVAYSTAPRRRAGRPPPKVAEAPSLALDRSIKISARTEEAFGTIVNVLFEYAVGFKRIEENPWSPVTQFVRHPKDHSIEASTVPTKADVWRMADAAVNQTGDWEVGVLLKLWFVTGMRPEEFFALRGSDFHLGGDEPYVRLTRAEVVVSGVHNVTGEGTLEARGLKHRNPGEHRDVDIPFADLVRDLRLLVSRLPKPSSRLLARPDGGPINRDAWRARVFNPARDVVFGTSEIDELRNLVPRRMRHAGITWRLQKGIGIDEVARRVGNSPQMILKHYASAIPQASRRNIELMEADDPHSGLRSVV